ncbi:DUF2255 family protein [Streptomyces sp. NPDC001068]|uniref:DUF2255 family protein n=1 Tax=Streptomyces sp. NPDC001068 TaxID=3364544 RepID=UPI0036CE2295
MTAWTPREQTLLTDTYALVLTAGDTPGSGVEIGMVVVDGDLYVRAYRGVRSRWYRAAQDHGHGRIEVAGVTREVLLRTRDLTLTPAIDNAFRAKYGALADALTASPQARAATIRIEPCPRTPGSTSQSTPRGTHESTHEH